MSNAGMGQACASPSDADEQNKKLLCCLRLCRRLLRRIPPFLFTQLRYRVGVHMEQAYALIHYSGSLNSADLSMKQIRAESCLLTLEHDCTQLLWLDHFLRRFYRLSLKLGYLLFLLGLSLLANWAVSLITGTSDSKPDLLEIIRPPLFFLMGTNLKAWKSGIATWLSRIILIVLAGLIFASDVASLIGIQAGYFNSAMLRDLICLGFGILNIPLPGLPSNTKPQPSFSRPAMTARGSWRWLFRQWSM